SERSAASSSHSSATSSDQTSAYRHAGFLCRLSRRARSRWRPTGDIGATPRLDARRRPRGPLSACIRQPGSHGGPKASVGQFENDGATEPSPEHHDLSSAEGTYTVLSALVGERRAGPPAGRAPAHG